jgi:hypothetical protein
VTPRAKISRKAPARLVPTVLVPAVLVIAAPAAAQVTGEVSVQRFDPAPGPRNFITTRSASTDGNLVWSAGLMANYSFEPLVVTGPDGDRLAVVENMITGDAYGSFTIIPQLQVGLKVPVTWSEGSGMTEDGLPAPDGLSAVGLGDIQIEAKGRFYGKPGEVIVLGAYLYGTVPMGNLTAEGAYIGNATAAVGGALIANGTLIENLTWGVNLGGIYREEATIGNSVLGPEGRWGAAAGYGIGPLLRVVVDAFGSTNFTGEPGGNNIEVDGGVQLTPLGSPLTISVGGGAGVLKGIGIPTARGFLGVLYNAESRDRDQDGISDDADACPEEAEDRDGFEDSDGCPDFDNDQDSMPDEVDKCADKAEDIDGFEDKDGCPEDDNDKDGVVDTSDMCPAQPETVNGVDDLDGCPDSKDSDKDGVADEADKCPNEPEDTDGYEDTDGCPDPDNDKDGVPDNMDECIDEPEDGKGKGTEKKDGCPLE